MSVVHSREYSQAFSLNKQSAIGTAIANAQINKSRPVRSFAPITEEKAPRITDRTWYNKGHSHPTFVDVIQKYYKLPSQERSASSLETLYAAAMVMGNVVTVQPNSATNPLEYQHTVTFQDPRTNKEVLYTSIGEEMGAEYKKVLSGAWISNFSLRGERNDHVILALEGAGRRYVDGTYTVPAITSAAFYKTLYGSLYFDAAAGLGAPLVDISVEVLSWSVNVSQNPKMYFLMGNPSLQEDHVTKALIGDQTASAQIVVFMNITHRNRFLNANNVGVKIICMSPDNINSSRHTLTIDIPKARIASEQISDQDQTVALTLMLDEDTIMKDTSDPYIQFKFLSDVGTGELLVAA